MFYLVDKKYYCDEQGVCLVAAICVSSISRSEWQRDIISQRNIGFVKTSCFLMAVLPRHCPWPESLAVWTQPISARPASLPRSAAVVGWMFSDQYRGTTFAR